MADSLPKNYIIGLDGLQLFDELDAAPFNCQAIGETKEKIKDSVKVEGEARSINIEDYFQ